MADHAAALGLLAGALGVVGTVPYLRDVLRRTTVPHRGTWLIWTVLEAIAVASQAADGARWSLVPLVAQAVGTCVVLVASIRLGCGGLSRADVALLTVAAAGLVGWRVVGEPGLATVCVIAADLAGAAMMLPKVWLRPESETLATFLVAGVGGAAMLGAVDSASPSLIAYPLYFALVNLGLALLIGGRRRALARPVPHTTTALVRLG